jgi:hypothetical protein
MFLIPELARQIRAFPFFASFSLSTKVPRARGRARKMFGNDPELFRNCPARYHYWIFPNLAAGRKGFPQ